MPGFLKCIRGSLERSAHSLCLEQPPSSSWDYGRLKNWSDVNEVWWKSFCPEPSQASER